MGEIKTGGSCLAPGTCLFGQEVLSLGLFLVPLPLVDGAQQITAPKWGDHRTGGAQHPCAGWDAKRGPNGIKWGYWDSQVGKSCPVDMCVCVCVCVNNLGVQEGWKHGIGGSLLTNPSPFIPVHIHNRDVTPGMAPA